MFTGLIEEIGKVRSIQSGARSSKLSVTASKVLDDVRIGDSIAVNGVCLTVTSHKGSEFTVDVMGETLSKSSFGKLRSGSQVNLERAMPANGRFGGHIVSGHIDGTGIIHSIVRDDIAIVFKVRTVRGILKYIVNKGSITIDGISLTVVEVNKDTFSVSIIPHTAKETTMGTLKIGSTVNLENDMIGKYIERFVDFDKRA